MKKVEKVIKEVNLVPCGEYSFAHYENAQRVAMAFAQAHYFITFVKKDEFYTLIIYKHNNTK